MVSRRKDLRIDRPVRGRWMPDLVKNLCYPLVWSQRIDSKLTRSPSAR
jgi:hypothetical protein